MKIKFKKLKKEAIFPAYAHPGDAGFDLYSTGDYLLKPGERRAFGLGLAGEISKGFFVLFKDRSGLALKQGIHVLAGVLDSGYRGEWKVVLINLGKRPYQIEIGDKIAQGILLPSPQAKMIEVKSFSRTRRGGRGFGSTG